MSYIEHQECIKRAIKYIVQAVLIALTCYYIPKNKLTIHEIVSISIIASISFSIIDIMYPSISNSIKNGNSIYNNLKGNEKK
jgi:hypothetical protein